MLSDSPTDRTDNQYHDDVIEWKHFPRYWPFVRGYHRSPVISPHKGQWRRALIFSLICVCIHGWVNNREAGDLRRHRAHYDVTVMNRANTQIISLFLKSMLNHWIVFYIAVREIVSFLMLGLPANIAPKRLYLSTPVRMPYGVSLKIVNCSNSRNDTVSI